jgi:hypothetical protein
VRRYRIEGHDVVFDFPLIRSSAGLDSLH